MEFSLEVLTFLFFIASLAGFIDAMAGGGGLLTVPALLAAGVPPTQASRPINCRAHSAVSQRVCTLFVMV
ncbi:membrane protein yfcA [Vibrio ishigakensis]|uniref:Membrane protein yfcA n=1 Tax=Vibrio ishigakensis TaxID=1481914 RepID=A0A0B8QIZ5_9VIBR|nr:membrane protein yfcA [Vibrio ishigakensis]